MLDQMLGSPTRYSLDASHSCPDAALRDDPEQADLARLVYVVAAAKLLAERLLRHTDLDNANLVPVLFPKESHCSTRDRLLVVCIFGSQRVVGQNGIIYRLLNCIQLILGQHRSMREVKPQPVRCNQRARLLDMLSQDIPQLAMQEMGCGMVAGNIHPTRGIDHRPGRIVHAQISAGHQSFVQQQTRNWHPHGFYLNLPTGSVFSLLIACQQSLIRDLTATLNVEWGGSQHNLHFVARTAFANRFTVTQNGDNHCLQLDVCIIGVLDAIRAEPTALFQVLQQLTIQLKVLRIHGRELLCLPAPLSLLLQRRLKASLVHREPTFRGNVPRQVQGKAKGVV